MSGMSVIIHYSWSLVDLINVWWKTHGEGWLVRNPEDIENYCIAMKLISTWVIVIIYVFKSHCSLISIMILKYFAKTSMIFIFVQCCKHLKIHIPRMFYLILSLCLCLSLNLPWTSLNHLIQIQSLSLSLTAVDECFSIVACSFIH